MSYATMKYEIAKNYLLNSISSRIKIIFLHFALTPSSDRMRFKINENLVFVFGSQRLTSG